MKLQVIAAAAEKEKPWYADGLKFTCQQCGNCCTGSTGYVWLSDLEITRLAEYLNLSERQMLRRYAHKVGRRYSLNEIRTAAGQYDCVFLKEEQIERNKRDAAGNEESIVYTKRTCTVYPVRPLQCRTWPFWDSNLSSPEMWNESAKRCHGMNHGSRVFSQAESESLRDATDWPQNPPTSAKK